MNRPDSSTSPRRSFNAGIRGAYCALTSTSGILGTGALPEDVAVQEPGRGEADRDDDSVVHPTEILVYPSVAGSDTPAEAGEGEGPDRRAGEREDRVAAEGRAEDAGGDGDERADQRSHPPEEDGRVAPALEPLLGTGEVLWRQVEPAAAALDQRPPAVRTDPPADDRPEQEAERPGHADDDVATEGRLDRV